ncbi:MAG: DUF4382 domain-containing protein [Candidatus Paceibacterota bacterium]
MNKAITIIAILAIVFLAGILLFGAGEEPKASGQVYFGITDAAADMGNISEITMTTERVELHSQTEGWMTASSEQESFNLLELNASGQNQLWAQADVNEGAYDRVRVTIASVEVTTEDGETTEATLPSNHVTLDGTVNVTTGATSSVLLDVEADRSIHVAADSSFVFAPVIQMETRSNSNVEVTSENMLTITGGSVDADVTFGVDLAGNSQANFSLDADQAIELNEDGSINVDLGGESATSSDDNDSSADVETDTEINAETDGAGAGVEVETEANVQ